MVISYTKDEINELYQVASKIDVNEQEFNSFLNTLSQINKSKGGDDNT